MNQLITSQSLIVFGLAVVIFVFLMRRMFLRAYRPAASRHASHARNETESDEMSAAAVVEKLEVRLFDFAREVEGRMQTRIAVLDRLIVDADREILRLQDLLSATEGISGAGSQATALADPRSAETLMSARTLARQPDVILPKSGPADSGHRDAA
jgi:hypothetical protein